MRLFHLLLLTAGPLAGQTAAWSIVRESPAYHTDVIYAGVDNLLRVGVPGIETEDLELVPAFGSIRPDSVAGAFVWSVCHLDSSRATLYIRDRKRNRALDTVIFKAKMIPPPKFIFTPGGCKPLNGGAALITSTIRAVVDSFPLPARCTVVRFTGIYLPKGQDPVVRTGTDWRFDGALENDVKKAKPGDVYTYRDFRYRCGCDPTVRRSTEVLRLEIK